MKDGAQLMVLIMITMRVHIIERLHYLKSEAVSIRSVALSSPGSTDSELSLAASWDAEQVFAAVSKIKSISIKKKHD